ncbi:MAG: adenylate/guanylate cyclase domain-containing protein [Candidatus Woesearchaeota archaeon]|nr:MAG: adenylate/guanylate cyclase domain-containing protein [Candidatus Woesearchaeota archaeon]
MEAKKKLKTLIAISLIVAVFLSIIFSMGVFSNLQLSLGDNLYGGLNSREDIVILAIDDKSLQEIGRWPWDRKVFADALRKLKESKVVGVDVAFFEKSNENSDNELVNAIGFSKNVVLPVEYTSYTQEKVVRGEGILLPIEGIEENALDLGYINVITDKDGITRAANLNVLGDYDSFTSAIYQHYTGNEFNKKYSRFLINFVGKPDSFKTYSISDFLNGKLDEALFKGKVVLIGSTAPDLHDDHLVPTSKGKRMAGVEVHANTLQTMLNGNFLEQEANILVIISMFLAAVIVGLVFFFANTWIAFIITLILMISYIFAAILFFNKGILINLVYAPLAFFITNITSVATLYIGERKEKMKVLSAFEKYVSPILLNDILRKTGELKLGGDKATITILFSDIRGFTTFSEQMKPEDLVEVLNEYLTEMTNVIMNNKGLVDKYIGDAIMAFWGAPLKEKDHAALACTSALEMIKALENLNKKFKSEGKHQLDIGIGLNTGEAIVGNMGSEKRFDYTAIGDSVNLGSRLEGITKFYGVKIIISESVYEEVKDKFFMRELDYVSVKGKKKPIKIYGLMNYIKNESEEQEELKKCFEEGLKFYRKKEFDVAISWFKKCKNDKSSLVFIDRCHEYKKNPPPDEWDGVYVLKEK